MKTIDGAAPAGASSVIFDGTTGNIPELRNLQLLLDSAREEYFVRNRWFGFWRERRVPVSQVATLFIRQGFSMENRSTFSLIGHKVERRAGGALAQLNQRAARS
jgi:hypothetical protein